MRNFGSWFRTFVNTVVGQSGLANPAPAPQEYYPQDRVEKALFEFSLDTPKTLQALCEAGADCSISWFHLLAQRPQTDPEQLKAFWETMKILFAHCPNKKAEDFSKDLNTYSTHLTCYKEDFEILGMFIAKGADLFLKRNHTQTAKSLLFATICEGVYFTEYRNLLENIPSLDARLSGMSELNKICMELSTKEWTGDQAARHLVKFGTDLGNEVLTINQLKIVAGLLFLGTHQKENVLYQLPFEIILRLMLLSLEKPESISQSSAIKMAREFFIWQPTVPKAQSEKEAHAQIEQTFRK